MKQRVLIVDDEAAIGRSFAALLEGEGYGVDLAGSIREARRGLGAQVPDVVVCDIQLPDGSGLDLLRLVREKHPSVGVVMITAYATLENSIQALRAGAHDYLTKPLRFNDLLASIEKASAGDPVPRGSEAEPRETVPTRENPRIVGDCPCLTNLRDEIERVAPTPSTVLISGESGTGKELIARELHARSKQSFGPFLAVNCGAIPETLLESELFGYRRGAFTGADRDKAGLFAMAAGGTLFLDEIGDLPIQLQPKLLRVLEQREFMPLGGSKTTDMRARILAASNRPIERMIQEGTFREDLYYRLRIIEIRAPTLRSCRNVIPELVEHFIEKFNRELGLKIEGLEPAAMQRVVQHDWPGNVRELEHQLQRAMILARGTELTERDLFRDEPARADSDLSLREATRRYEQTLVRDAVRRAEGDKREAARRLEISLATLYAKLADTADQPPPSKPRRAETG